MLSSCESPGGLLPLPQYKPPEKGKLPEQEM